MTQLFVQLPAGDTVTLDLDLNTTTVAAVKTTIDARLESAWRASGVRILRSDLPFSGIRLRYRNRILAPGEVLSGCCEVGHGTTLHAEWPPESEKSERRKRYGKGGDDETVLETRRVRGGKKKKKKKNREKPIKTKASREAAKKKRGSKSAAEPIQSTHEIGGGAGGGDDEDDDGCASDAPPGCDNTELEVGDQHAESNGNGTQCPSEPVAVEEQDEQRAEMEEEEEEEGRDDGSTAEGEQVDPFADEEGNKENEEPPAWMFGEESFEEESPPADDGEGLLFDERNSGMEFDLMEEMSDY